MWVDLLLKIPELQKYEHFYIKNSEFNNPNWVNSYQEHRDICKIINKYLYGWKIKLNPYLRLDTQEIKIVGVGRYINSDDLVGVVHKTDFGSAWSFYDDIDTQEIKLFHPKLVKKLIGNESTKALTSEWIKDNLFIDDEDDYYAGELSVTWLPKNTKFIVEEYDGTEIIKLVDELRIFKTY